MSAIGPTFAPVESITAFPVYFSNPSPWSRLLPHPASHWQLFGAGEIVFKRNSIVLRGRRRRPFGFTVRHAAEIAREDVFNVVQQRRIVQFHVRVPLSSEKLLQIWADDVVSAEEIAALLPQERTFVLIES